MDPITLAAALVPFVQHAGRIVLGKWAKGTGAEPQTVDEAVTLGELDVKRLEAAAKIEAAYGPVSVWVNNLRAMQRPVIAYLTLTTWVTASLIPNFDPDTYDQVSGLASVVFAYLFADRTASYVFRRRV